MEVRRFESQRDGFMERNDWGDYVLFTDFEKVNRERNEAVRLLSRWGAHGTINWDADRSLVEQVLAGLVADSKAFLASIERPDKVE